MRLQCPQCDTFITGQGVPITGRDFLHFHFSVSFNGQLRGISVVHDFLL